MTRARCSIVSAQCLPVDLIRRRAASVNVVVAVGAAMLRFARAERRDRFGPHEFDALGRETLFEQTRRQRVRTLGKILVLLPDQPSVGEDEELAERRQPVDLARL